MSIYNHPQETWTEAECAKRAKSAPADAFGNHPPRGIIAPSGSPYCHYGGTVRWNGGKVFDDVWYEAEHMPLPSIPDTYEIVPLSSWGLVIRKKTATP